MNLIRPKQVKDHFLSQETFSIDWANPQIGKTLVESDCDLQRYYQSDDYISHQSEKKGLLGTAYNVVQYYMFRRKFKIILEHQPQLNRLLDFGCGVGGFLQFLSKKGVQVSGVESNSNAVEIAREKGLAVINTLESHSADKNDCISLWHVLEHMASPKETILHLKEFLSDSGLLVVAVPNPNAWDANYYQEHWAAWDVPRHLWHFTPQGIERMVVDLGFEFVAKYPMPLDAFYVSLLSEGYKKRSFKWIRVLWNGFRSTLYGIKSKDFSSQIYLFRNV